MSMFVVTFLLGAVFGSIGTVAYAYWIIERNL
jgi:hypothetical protein